MVALVGSIDLRKFVVMKMAVVIGLGKTAVSTTASELRAPADFPVGSRSDRLFFE